MDPPSGWQTAQIAELIAESRAAVKAPVSDLPSGHRDIFEQALGNVLSTETSRMPYAQAIDGFATINVARDVFGWVVDTEHPVCQNNHDKLCTGAWETMEAVYSAFSIDVLHIDLTSTGERFGSYRATAS